VLDELGLKSMRRDVSCIPQCRGYIATLDFGPAQQIAFFVKLRSAWLKRVFGIGNRFENFIVDVYCLGCSSRGASVDRGNRGDNVAYVTGFFAFSDKHWPVIVDQTLMSLTGNIGSSDYRYDPWNARGLAGIDAFYKRSRVLR
jgi:hypothetical protein